MKEKTLHGAFWFSLLVIACLAGSLMLTGCDNEVTPESGENAITSFVIGGAAGAIKRNEISVIVPKGMALDALEPVITISDGARISPESGVANNFTNPTTYAVIAENGAAKTYVVTVMEEEAAPSSVLESITVEPPYKTEYAQGEPLALEGLVVTGTYLDGTETIEDVTMDNISNYDSTKVGQQRVTVTLDEKIAFFNVTVVDGSSLDLSIGFVADGNDGIAIYGIPEGGIVLSMGQDEDLPQKMTISIGASDTKAVYDDDSISWSINGGSAISKNIITIDAAQYTFEKPHSVTIRVTKDEVDYSKTISFKVVR